MKAVILCGGLGTRFSEETKNKPAETLNESVVNRFKKLANINK